MIFAVAILALTLSSVQGFGLSPLTLRRQQGMMTMKQPEEGNFMQKMQKVLKSKVLPAIVASSLLLNMPTEADAARSGGRSGGSSFSRGGGGGFGGGGGGGMRSSTRLSGSVGYGGPTIMPIMPMYSPFGYSPFGFSPFGFMPINFNVLILAGVAYVVYNALKNRVGGSDFTGDGIESGRMHPAQQERAFVDWLSSPN